MYHIKPFTLPGRYSSVVECGLVHQEITGLIPVRAYAQVSVSCPGGSWSVSLSPSPFISLKINKKILKKTKPLLIVRLGFNRVGVSTALLPMRLNICASIGHWQLCVYVTPPLHRSFLHCSAKAITLRILIILLYRCKYFS